MNWAISSENADDACTYSLSSKNEAKFLLKYGLSSSVGLGLSALPGADLHNYVCLQKRKSDFRVRSQLTTSKRMNFCYRILL